MNAQKTYTLSGNYSNEATSRRWRIVNGQSISNGNMVFVVPVKRDGSPTTLHMEARLGQWVARRDLTEA